MRVHHSLPSSYFMKPLQTKTEEETSSGTPFVLPNGQDSRQQKSSAGSSGGGTSSSISNAFWLSQLGLASSSDADATDQTSAPADDTGTDDTSSPAEDTSGTDLLAEFARLAAMSPAERIRADYLSAHHLTEDSFSKLPADQQKSINDEITQEIKEKLGGNTGSSAGTGTADADDPTLG